MSSLIMTFKENLYDTFFQKSRAAYMHSNIVSVDKFIVADVKVFRFRWYCAEEIVIQIDIRRQLLIDNFRRE